jgi:two-component system, cell cycle sensor histidine kinase and response regulator CckA
MPDAAGQDKRASILVLDDEAGFRGFVARALRGAGYSVTDTGDAAEALRLIDSLSELDVLITDIKLSARQPHGIAIGELATLKRYRMRVIYMSGDPAQIPADFIDETETPLMGKPFRLAELLTVVEAVLR